MERLKIAVENLKSKLDELVSGEKDIESFTIENETLFLHLYVNYVEDRIRAEFNIENFTITKRWDEYVLEFEINLNNKILVKYYHQTNKNGYGLNFGYVNIVTYDNYKLWKMGFMPDKKYNKNVYYDPKALTSSKNVDTLIKKLHVHISKVKKQFKIK